MRWTEREALDVVGLPRTISWFNVQSTGSHRKWRLIPRAVSGVLVWRNAKRRMV
jgi:hypothetical protein